MFEEIMHILLHALKDSAVTLPFLFAAYLLIEFLEHKASNKIESLLKKSGKFGAAVGALLGVVPQCGFSVAAANLYASRVISLGTLIAVFVSTSDEAIPILIATPNKTAIVLQVLGIKIIIALIAGFLIDLLFRSKHKEDATEHIHDLCHNCGCEDEHNGIVKPAIKHTLLTFGFIILINFALELAIHFIGDEKMASILMTNSLLQPVIAAIIGLIPNCAASILLTDLYINGSISMGALIAGLSTGAGVGLAVLFKANKRLKENLTIVGVLVLIGSVAGIILDLII